MEISNANYNDKCEVAKPKLIIQNSEMEANKMEGQMWHLGMQLSRALGSAGLMLNWCS